MPACRRRLPWSQLRACGWNSQLKQPAPSSGCRPPWSLPAEARHDTSHAPVSPEVSGLSSSTHSNALWCAPFFVGCACSCAAGPSEGTDLILCHSCKLLLSFSRCSTCFCVWTLAGFGLQQHRHSFYTPPIRVPATLSRLGHSVSWVCLAMFTISTL